MSTTYDLAMAKLNARIKETQQEVAYWRRQQALRENHHSKIEAGARVLLWESQLRVLNAKREALIANHQPATV